MNDAATQATVNIEELGPCQRKLTISLPGDAVSEQLESAISVFMAQAQLPGFRPGRVPRRLIEKKFGSDIQREAKQRLIAGAYQDAVKEHELEVLGEPTAEHLDEITLASGEDVTVELQVEVAPQFDLPTYEGLKVLKPQIEVPDERIDKAIERMQVNEGQLEPQDQAAPGDYLIGRGIMRDASAGDDETPLLDIPGAVVQVPKEEDEGRGMILGVMVDDFAKQVGSPKAGDAPVITCKGPENHETEAVRNKDLAITFEVDQVQRIIPAPLDELLPKLGLPDENAFREAVRQRLEYRAQIDQQAAMRQQAAQHLLKAVDFELPERLTAQQAARNLNRQALELQYRGVDPNVIETRLAEMRSASQEIARRELKLFFILARIAKELEVNVTNAEVEARITQMARARGEQPQKLADQMVKNGQINMVAQQIREHKALDAILDKAEVEEVPVETYNERIKKEEHVTEIDEAADE